MEISGYVIIFALAVIPIALYWSFIYYMAKYRGGSYYTCTNCKTVFYIKKVKMWPAFDYTFRPASVVKAYCPHCKCRCRCIKNDP